MQVIAILRGQPAPIPAKNGVTGHFKLPQPFADVTRLGLKGDFIADSDNHGGPDQAVYLFGDLDRQWWETELSRPCPPGFFGENLLISELASQTLCLGDTLAIGDVCLQITAPRIPCATYAAHIGSGQAIKQFYRAARPGAYARVLREGSIAPAAAVTFTPFDSPRIPVTTILAQTLRHFDDLELLRELARTPAHHNLLQMAQTRLGAG